MSLLSAGLFLAGCVKKEDSARLTVVTSFYPMYIMTANIVRDVPGINLVNMAPPSTGCLHDYQMTPQDMTILGQADILVINGAGMENFLDNAVRQNSNLKVVDASQGIELIEHDGHPNPHIFASISGAIRQVQNIGAGLEKYDPEYLGYYRENAQRYLAQLEILKDSMYFVLKDVKNRDIITFHEAFPYLAKELGLNILAVVEKEPGAEPSAGDLAEIIKIVRQKKVKAIFAEPQYPAKSAEAIARETEAKVFLLDPAVTGPLDPEAYITIMGNNIKVLKEALR
jgi:zinc transport system substrate-binding protein